ncbi:9886_t:CDS:2, partial [Ambispora gerdemannii]
MSSTEHYPGYAALLSYFNEREHVNWSYYEFLTLNRDVIISLPSIIKDWNGLDSTWTRRFLINAEMMLESKDFETLKVKGAPISQRPDLGVSVNVLAQVMVVAPLVSQRPDSRVSVNVDSERSKDGLKAYWENVIHEQKKLKVKRTHILGSLDLLDEAGKHNVKDLSSEGLSNSFPVDMSSASKHALESTNLISPQENKKIKTGENQASVEEGTTQEDMLNSVIETSNIFREAEFPGYYDKLKKIWSTREAGSNYYVIDLKNKEVLKEVHNLLDDEKLKSLFDRLTLEDENKYISMKALEYMTLFDKIIDDYLRDDDDDVVEKKFIETKDEAISKMEKVVYSLDGLTKRFNYLSHTLPIPTEQYEGFLYPDIHIIRSISSHLSTIISMDGIVKNTTESHITSLRYFSCERTISTKMDSQTIDYRQMGLRNYLKGQNKSPYSYLRSGEPSNPDPDKFKDDRQKLMKGVFALNKFIIRTGLPTYEVCKTLGVFLAQGFEDNLEIGQIIYIGPGLYLFSPFTDPNLIILTSPFNLEHSQRYIINPTSKYTTGFTPDRPQIVTFSKFLPKEETSGK